MELDLDELWVNSLEVIKTELTEVSFNTWLKTIEPITISDNRLILGAPNEFTKSILSARYLTLIKNAVKQVSNINYDISFLIPGEEISNSSREVSEKIKDTMIYKSQLNPKYIFDTFVIGNSNKFAQAAALAVAEAPARAYNPLFIYGGVGLGKTHLMHAIGHYILGQNPSANVMYVSSEKFTNELINSIRDDRNIEFRDKYRNIDVLLIDDIQFIAGKERTQEEFFHTFNALHEDDKQIIVSSDRPPKEIPTLEDRLRSRFEWGLIADIQAPDFETRIAILKKKAQIDNLNVSDDVMAFIASKIKSNIRELEGALIRIVAYSSLTNRDVTIDLAEEALKDIMSLIKPKEINVTYIKEVVSRHMGIKMESFDSKKRTRSITFPRQIAMYLSRELTELSLPKIGEEFGGRDHTTVIHAHEKILLEMESDESFKKKIEKLTKEIKGN